MTPVVRQTFRARELVDMIVQGAGKDVRKLQHVLRAGTVIFRSYRYWWEGFEADAAELGEVLATYPDADPARAFSVAGCTEVILESSGSPPRHSLRIKRAEAEGKSGVLSFLRSGNFWDALMNLGEPGKNSLSGIFVCAARRRVRASVDCGRGSAAGGRGQPPGFAGIARGIDGIAFGVANRAYLPAITWQMRKYFDFPFCS